MLSITSRLRERDLDVRAPLTILSVGQRPALDLVSLARMQYACGIKDIVLTYVGEL
jgi:hypothetical protein